MSTAMDKLGRADIAALIVQTLNSHNGERLATLETSLGTVRLLNPADTIKDRLLWWYLEGDRQCWEQALDIARNHAVSWSDLETWHKGENYAERYMEFRKAV